MIQSGGYQKGINPFQGLMEELSASVTHCPSFLRSIRIAIVLAPFSLDFTGFFEVATFGCPTP